MNSKNILMSFYEAKYPNIFFGISILIIKNKKMKKTNLLTAATLCLALGFTSCSKDNDIECHPCHIAKDAVPGDEIEFELNDGIDFCGDDLEEAEANGYQLVDTLYSESGDTLLPGFYAADVVHCEEHAGE